MRLVPLLLTLSGCTFAATALDPRAAKGFDHFYNLEYDLAIAEFRKLTTIEPNNPNFHNHVAQGVLYREMLRGKEARLHVRDRAGIPDEQLAAMVEAARARETELRAEREAGQRRQRLDAMLQRSERALSEQEKLTPEARASLEGAVRDARVVLASGDDALVVTALAAFAAVLQPLGGELAALAAPPPARARLQPVVSAPPKIKADAATIDLEGGDEDDE